MPSGPRFTDLDVEQAEYFARVAHWDQKYGKGQLPHMYHVEKVAGMVKRFYGDSDPLLLIGAYLHDTIEDTFVCYKRIGFFFGKEVADLVWNVTNEMGRNRKEKFEKTAPKIGSSWRSLALKLCDRSANVEHSLQEGGLFRMYQREYPLFKEKLGDLHMSAPQIPELWSYLDILFKRDKGVPR